MKRALRVILVLLIVFVYAISKVQKIHRNSISISNTLKNKQVQTKVTDYKTEKNTENITGNETVLINNKNK